MDLDSLCYYCVCILTCIVLVILMMTHNWYDRAPVHLEEAGWGSSGKEEEKEGCYDNFMLVFGKYVIMLLYECASNGILNAPLC